MSTMQNNTNNRTKRYSLDFKNQVLEELKTEGAYAVSKKHGISNSQLYKWKKAFEEHGLEGLANKSSRPHHQPKKTSNWLIKKIIGLKKEKPEMGAQALSLHLKRNEAVDLSPNTVAKVFKKHELPDGDEGYAKNSHYVKADHNKRIEKALETDLNEWERFCRPNPNDLWQMDLMSFHIREGQKLHLISALDDCSRMIVGWGLYRQETSENVLEVLRCALAKFGAPKEILSDNGPQFKHWNGITQFEKLLSKLQIHLINARPHHPQTCGKIEAFHKTIKRELIDKEYFMSQEQAVERIARFIDHYNHARPHTSLDGFTPADRYYGIIDAVKIYLKDMQQPKNAEEEPLIGVGRSSKIYLIGKFLGQDVRIQELAGQLSIYVNNQLKQDIHFR